MLTERNRRLFGDGSTEERQDLGDWVFALAEFTIAPHWSFSASNMYNFDDDLHFYDFSLSYARKANRFSLGYAKQVAGIICSGGICRLEPAFSGLKIGITSSF